MQLVKISVYCYDGYKILSLSHGVPIFSWYACQLPANANRSTRNSTTLVLTFHWPKTGYDYQRKASMIGRDRQFPSTTLRISHNTPQSLCASGIRFLHRSPKRNSKILIHENPAQESSSNVSVGPSCLLMPANKMMSNMYFQRKVSRNQMPEPP